MSQLKTSAVKQLDFYYRAKKQYENAAKPFTYQLNIFSTQPKPKKFMIIINKFIDVLKQGMKQEYSMQQELKDNYWNQLEKYYAEGQYQMSYLVQNSYQKKRNKLRLYFGLLLHNKKIFDVIGEVTEKMGYMYHDSQSKLGNLEKMFEPVDFLKDGQYTIMSEFIYEYEKYEQTRKQEQKLRQRLAEKQKKKQEQLQEAKRKKEQQEKTQRQRKQKQQKDRLQKQRIQKQRKQKEQQKLNNNLADGRTAQTLGKLDDSIGFIPENYRTQYAHDKTIELSKRKQQNKQTLDELPGWNQKKKGHQKNSQVLFEQKYKDEFQVFSFRLKPDIESNQQSKKQVCFECNKPLKQGFYFFGGNQNQCMYTGEWYCNEHMAEQRISIPWKALQSFDLRGYQVSRKSYIEIKSYYQKPIIEIKSQEPVVKHSRVLYQFLVLKRQIHLMYDSICDLQLMQPLLKKKLNYCLKQNLFSLKNLYDIYNGHQGPSLQRQYEILSKHFYRCERCQKRKGYVCPKCKDPVKIFAFQLKETIGCSNCRKLYHRACLTNGKCDCQEQD